MAASGAGGDGAATGGDAEPPLEHSDGMTAMVRVHGYPSGSPAADVVALFAGKDVEVQEKHVHAVPGRTREFLWLQLSPLP